MAFEIRECTTDVLVQYSQIPTAFQVTSVLRVHPIDRGLGGIELIEEEVSPPYVKDYDALEDEGPQRWLTRFDLRSWGFFLAYEGSQPIGGATVALGAPGICMLRGGDDQVRHDLAVLWDIRVHLPHRCRGIGSELFRHASSWARQRGCKQLKIETQNVNVPACRFYAKQDCRLGSIDLYGYAGDPRVEHEAMLLWYLDL